MTQPTNSIDSELKTILVRAFDKGYEKSIQVVGLADEHYIAHQETMVAEAIAQIETLITEGKLEQLKLLPKPDGTCTTVSYSFKVENAIDEQLLTLQASLKGKEV